MSNIVSKPVVIRVKGCVKVCFRQERRKLNRFCFRVARRHQTLMYPDISAEPGAA
jgi:hypothetical protein